MALTKQCSRQVYLALAGASFLTTLSSRRLVGQSLDGLYFILLSNTGNKKARLDAQERALFGRLGDKTLSLQNQFHTDASRIASEYALMNRFVSSPTCHRITTFKNPLTSFHKLSFTPTLPCPTISPVSMSVSVVLVSHCCCSAHKLAPSRPLGLGPSFYLDPPYR